MTRNSAGRTVDEFIRGACQLPYEDFHKLAAKCEVLSEAAAMAGNYNLAEFYFNACNILSGPIWSRRSGDAT